MESLNTQELNVDQVIAVTGGFGSMQMVMLLYNCLFVVYCGIQSVAPVYSGMTPTFYCSLPNFTSSTCNSSCPSYVYPNEFGTMVAEFDLACGLRSWLNSIYDSSYWVGYLLGVVISGYLFDIFGRKRSIIYLSAGQVIFAFVMIFLNNIYLLIINRLIFGFFISGASLGACLIVLEYAPSNRIAIVSQFVQVVFAFGEMFGMLSGYMFKMDWRMIYVVLALPTPFILLASIFLFPESCRWLLAVGRQAEAEKIARELAIRNGYKDIASKLHLLDTKELSTNVSLRYTWKNLFWPLNVLLLSISSFITWFACSIVYYGLTYGVQSLTGSIYVNAFLLALVEFPAFFIYILGNKFGRKYTTSIILLVAGLAVISMPFLHNIAGGWIATGLSLVGKMGSTAVFEFLYFYQIELFPSSVRGVGLGLCSMFARVAVIISPVVQKLGSISDYIVYFVFAIPSLIASVATFLYLPETKGKNLPESFEEVFSKEDLSHKRSRYYSRLSVVHEPNLIN